MMDGQIEFSRTLFLVVALVFLIITVTVSPVIAKQRALNAEEKYVANQLQNESCLKDWGANEGAATIDASVTGVTTDGYRVKVSMPYAYTVERDGEDTFADFPSEAVYIVSFIVTRRIQGEEISIC